MTRDDPTPDDHDGEEPFPEGERDTDDGEADANDPGDTEDSDIVDDPDISNDSDLPNESAVGDALDIPDDSAAEETTNEASRPDRRPAAAANSTDSTDP
ncbi:cell division control protein Cdc6, partial [Halococcus sp. IIIV-5B]